MHLIRTVLVTSLVITVFFGLSSYSIDDQTAKSLDDIVLQLASFSDYTIHLSGHTDNTGSAGFNDKLSEQRAIAVKKYLISKNVDSTKIQFDFYGEQKPAFPNTSDVNRALNRRVELTISGQKINIDSIQITPSPPQRIDSVRIAPKKQETVEAPVVQKQVKKKKVRRRLVWTGWRTGFHWSTAG